MFQIDLFDHLLPEADQAGWADVEDEDAVLDAVSEGAEEISYLAPAQGGRTHT